MQPESTADILFGVRRSVRYHNRRRALFDALVVITNASSVIFGSAAVWTFWKVTSGAIAADQNLGIYAALIVTVLSTLNLVLGGSQRARLHSDLARRFFILEREMVLLGEPSEEQRRQWMAKRLEIEADEPPVLRVIDTLCHNELIIATGADKKDLWHVPWPLYITGQFSNWFEDCIKPKAALQK